MASFKLLGLLFMWVPLLAQATGEVRQLQIGSHPRVYKIESLGPPSVPGKLRPIIVELHGSGNNVRDLNLNRYFPNFSTVANLPAVLLVRPQGANRVWDHLPGAINDWRRLSGSDGLPVDDVSFLKAVLDDVAAKDGGDLSQTVLYGISSGGLHHCAPGLRNAGSLSSHCELDRNFDTKST